MRGKVNALDNDPSTARITPAYAGKSINDLPSDVIV